MKKLFCGEMKIRGTRASPIKDCEMKIQNLYPRFSFLNESTSGAHKNLKIHGIIRIEVNEVINSIETFCCLKSVGIAHQIKPIGAPSVR